MSECQCLDGYGLLLWQCEGVEGECQGRRRTVRCERCKDAPRGTVDTPPCVCSKRVRGNWVTKSGHPFLRMCTILGLILQNFKKPKL